MTDKPLPVAEQDDEKAPVLGSWSRLYILVVILHFITIVLFYWLTEAYS